MERIKTRAIVWKGPHKIKYEQKYIQRPGQNEALVKILYNGLCTTDYEIIAGKIKGTKKDMIIGHEPVGIVLETGRPTEQIHKGSRVLLDTMIGCGQCRACLSGKIELCCHSTEIGFNTTGCWSDYAVFPIRNLYAIPDSIGMEESTLIESLTCEMGGIDTLNIHLGENILIIGSGLAMLLFVQLARLRGASMIAIKMYNYSERTALAKQFGADLIITDDYETLAKSKPVTTNGGFDKVIDAVGTENTINLSIRYACNGGAILLYGLRSVHTNNFPISDLIFKNLTLYGKTSAPHFWNEAIDLVARNYIKLKPLVSEVIDFSEVIDTVNKPKEHGGPIKRVIKINETI